MRPHRHYVGPTSYAGAWRDEAIRINPDGVALADARVRMLGRFVAGQDFGTRAALEDESDAQGLIGRMTEDAGDHAAATYVHLLVKVDPGVHIAASEWLFGKLVKNSYRRGVVYPIPTSVDDLHELARTGQ